MPGFRPRNTHIGDRAEYLGTFLLSWIAQALPVPRQEDYGIDFRGGLLWEDGQRITIGRSFSVQFKSNLATLFRPVGALDTRGSTPKWREDEVKWLLGRSPYPVDPTPLFLGHVDVPSAVVTLYSTAPMWNARWLGHPTEIEFDPAQWPPVADIDFGRPPFVRRKIADCYSKVYPTPVPGLQERVVVPIGPPVVRISAADAAGVDAEDRRSAVIRTLDEWIRLDTLNRLAALLEVPVCFWHAGWAENQPPMVAHQESCSYAHPDPNAGLAAAEIERSLRPFVRAWDGVRSAQGQSPVLGQEIERNAILDRLRNGGPAGRATEIDRLRKLTQLSALGTAEVADATAGTPR